MAPEIEVVLGDITAQHADAIVNAANHSLLGGGGVDGAIHRFGGPEILAACKELRRTRYPQGLPTGEAVETTAGRLNARWVIHTVGPIYSGTAEDPRLLAACHINSMRIAGDLGCRSVAFPAISTGAYRYPVGEAAPIAIRSVSTVPTSVELVRFVLFDRSAFAAFEQARDADEPPPPVVRDDPPVTVAGNDPAEPPDPPSSTGGWVDVVIESLGGVVDLLDGI
jgi:O-acetyl-ADP-ribose deacetylase (regulator of RNase III)